MRGGHGMNGMNGMVLDGRRPSESGKLTQWSLAHGHSVASLTAPNRQAMAEFRLAQWLPAAIK